MSIPLPRAFRLSAAFAAALVLLSGCRGETTAPDPLDAEALANRLEGLSRVSPQLDGIMLSAAGVHFRDAGRVTPITVLVGGRSETWYAASSEMVFPSLPCLPPAPGLVCPDGEPFELRHLFAVDGVNAKRLLAITTSTAGGGSFDQQNAEWPADVATAILVVRGSGVQAFATGGNATSSLAARLGACPEPPRRGTRAPPIESCERVSIAWQVEAEMTSVPVGDNTPATMNLVIPAVEVSGARLVLAPRSRPGS